MAGLGIGADIGGTNARAAVVDRATGRILAVHRERLGDRSPAAVAAVLGTAVRAAASEGGADLWAIPSVGVGVAGQCLGTTGMVLNAPNLGWRDVSFGELVERAAGVRVRIANDLSAAAWGEQQFGAARGVSDVVLVFVGSGVGSGLILGGRLHEGARGIAGELGHVKVRPTRPTTAPRRCGCGEVGCLEAYTGGNNLAARVREELAAGASSQLRELAAGDLSKVNASLVDHAAAQGDLYANGLWDEVSELLGTAIANLSTLLNPARVILGGGVILGCPELARRVRVVTDERISRSAIVGLSFERAALGDDAGVVGAALLG
jgi:glucokinase